MPARGGTTKDELSGSIALHSGVTLISIMLSLRWVYAIIIIGLIKRSAIE